VLSDISSQKEVIRFHAQYRGMPEHDVTARPYLVLSPATPSAHILFFRPPPRPPISCSFARHPARPYLVLSPATPPAHILFFRPPPRPFPPNITHARALAPLLTAISNRRVSENLLTENRLRFLMLSWRFTRLMMRVSGPRQAPPLMLTISSYSKSYFSATYCTVMLLSYNAY
jgi:hypothetical protein